MSLFHKRKKYDFSSVPFWWRQKANLNFSNHFYNFLARLKRIKKFFIFILSAFFIHVKFLSVLRCGRRFETGQSTDF